MGRTGWQGSQEKTEDLPTREKRVRVTTVRVKEGCRQRGGLRCDNSFKCTQSAENPLKWERKCEREY